MLVDIRELSTEELDFDTPCGLARFGRKCDEEAKYYALVHLKVTFFSTDCESRWTYIGERCYRDLIGEFKTCEICGVDGLQSNVMGI